MSIEEVGGISEPAYGSYGIYLVYYMADVPAGEVALEEIREAVEAEALSTKQTETYNAKVAEWTEAMNVEYHYENFGIAA